MRKQKLNLLFVAVSFSFVLFSCSPEHENEEHEFNLKWETAGPLGPVLGVVDCIEEGNNCAMQVKPKIGTTNRVYLDSFYAAYDKGTPEQFFNGEYWEEIFPVLQNHSQTLYNIRNGIYGVFVDTEGSITISTEVEPMKVNEDNIVIAYKYAGEEL